MICDCGGIVLQTDEDLACQSCGRVYSIYDTSEFDNPETTQPSSGTNTVMVPAIKSLGSVITPADAAQLRAADLNHSSLWNLDGGSDSRARHLVTRLAANFNISSLSVVQDAMDLYTKMEKNKARVESRINATAVPALAAYAFYCSARRYHRILPKQVQHMMAEMGHHVTGKHFVPLMIAFPFNQPNDIEEVTKNIIKSLRSQGDLHVMLVPKVTQVALALLPKLDISGHSKRTIAAVVVYAAAKEVRKEDPKLWPALSQGQVAKAAGLSLMTVRANYHELIVYNHELIVYNLVTIPTVETSK
jgi:transcription initiation factor TFIIIB Brf1 subunit/transcription initiation factor TFIIB